MKFYKIRAIIFIYLSRLFGKIFFLEIPPLLSVAGIVEKDGKLLFIDHTYIKGYGLPGGLVKPNEEIEDALAREVKEETGLDVINCTYFTSVKSFYHGAPTITIVFFVKTRGELQNSIEGSIIWLNPVNVHGKMAYASGEIILNKYLAKKVPSIAD